MDWGVDVSLDPANMERGARAAVDALKGIGAEQERVQAKLNTMGRGAPLTEFRSKAESSMAGARKAMEKVGDESEETSKSIVSGMAEGLSGVNELKGGLTKLAGAFTFFTFLPTILGKVKDSMLEVRDAISDTIAELSGLADKWREQEKQEKERAQQEERNREIRAESDEKLADAKRRYLEERDRIANERERIVATGEDTRTEIVNRPVTDDTGRVTGMKKVAIEIDAVAENARDARQALAAYNDELQNYLDVTEGKGSPAKRLQVLQDLRGADDIEAAVETDYAAGTRQQIAARRRAEALKQTQEFRDQQLLDASNQKGKKKDVKATQTFFWWLPDKTDIDYYGQQASRWLSEMQAKIADEMLLESRNREVMESQIQSGADFARSEIEAAAEAAKPAIEEFNKAFDDAAAARQAAIDGVVELESGLISASIQGMRLHETLVDAFTGADISMREFGHNAFKMLTDLALKMIELKILMAAFGAPGNQASGSIGQIAFGAFGFRAQHGTDFIAQGPGGTDRIPIMGHVTRGERVIVQTQQQQREEARGGSQPSIEVRPVIVVGNRAPVELLRGPEGAMIVQMHMDDYLPTYKRKLGVG